MSNQSVLPRRSRRLATIIPASHWISIGYSQLAAQVMERLQNDMKRYCDARDDTKIDLRGNSSHDGLFYHDMILPHWQKFANGLRGRTNVEEVQILGIPLPVSVLDILFPTCQSMNLSSLSFFERDLRMRNTSDYLRSSKQIPAWYSSFWAGI